MTVNAHLAHLAPLLPLSLFCLQALLFEPEASLCSSGALVVHSGSRTGRSPGDKRLVKDAQYQADVWWGQQSPNQPVDTRTFLALRQTAVDYLNSRDRVYVVDGFAGWDAQVNPEPRDDIDHRKEGEVSSC
jgi:ATP-dependent phosphoenolpyruvate carboxykinase